MSGNVVIPNVRDDSGSLVSPFFSKPTDLLIRAGPVAAT